MGIGDRSNEGREKMRGGERRERIKLGVEIKRKREERE